MITRSTTARTRAWGRRVRRGMARDAGYSTETVLVTALLAVMGLAVIGIIVAKVTAKANGIDLG
ncbi:hypothetical protein ACFQ7F_07795 [Streptomyces sp. NPDC056486]|uniref:hypothetical protein n=1 Tax=Streptomyces sp. NPDC056486 TaxID=3345835 RepID=UPI0036C86C2F